MHLNVSRCLAAGEITKCTRISQWLLFKNIFVLGIGAEPKLSSVGFGRKEALIVDPDCCNEARASAKLEANCLKCCSLVRYLIIEAI